MSMTDANRDRLHPLTLRFADPDLEARYWREQIDRGVVTIRACLVAAAFLYASFLLLDLHAVENNLDSVLALRLGVAFPAILAAAGLTFLPIFRQRSQLILSAATLTAGLAVVMMCAVVDGALAEKYYAGLITLAMFGSSVIRLHHVYALMSSLTTVACYLLVATLINPIPWDTLVINGFFLMTGIGFGAFANYAIEHALRSRFRGEIKLEMEKERAETLRDLAESASKAKSEFLATMSHELRTPLNAVIGFSQILRDGVFGELGEQNRGYAEHINESGEALLQIINDILEMSRAQAGRLQIKEDEVQVDRLFEAVAARWRPHAESQGLHLDVDHGARGTLIIADRKLLEQAMNNLLSNACKFTRPDGRIRFVSRIIDGALEIEIADTGIGIDQENIDLALAPFGQVESAHARSAGGCGIGLPLAKAIMDLHDGALAIDSVADAGTTVKLHLPAARIQVQSEAA
ncbi:hypothetical protein CKO28_04810 [Rhodovibrio sodomensis]|uniref:histidine kinase n=1 Tax=Rhodovibrio sodomensis TaxID=1088 RepID=A0ABS1DAU8_9PROT|nr:HAMP domain-containing sensor histidine kinase [Rhodovibrio sodomensis]MBK1667349.1 hypothetical protein [Rhodovibrio sodomensis]